MPQLSVIVPTFNEIDNVVELRDRVASALAGIDWEMIYVDDDSPDGTAQRLRELAQTDSRVRCIQRLGRRGLTSACIEGILASSAPLVSVIDADLQHDERLLPQMVALMQDPELDVVVGSRYADSGGVGEWDRKRAFMSNFATRLAKTVLKADLKDPMSGFFTIRHEVVLQTLRADISGLGFKILLDLFATSPRPLRFRELPYEFRNRVAGESKLDSNVAWEYFIMVLDKALGRRVPVRFIVFSLVGGFGVLVHLMVLSLLFKGLGSSFLAAQTTATMFTMTVNYLLNNTLTYRDRRLRGWAFLRGWVSFVLVCGVGAIANVGIAQYFFQQNGLWAASAIAGIVIGAVWNYVVTSVFTWKSRN